MELDIDGTRRLETPHLGNVVMEVLEVAVDNPNTRVTLRLYPMISSETVTIDGKAASVLGILDAIQNGANYNQFFGA